MNEKETGGPAFPISTESAVIYAHATEDLANPNLDLAERVRLQAARDAICGMTVRDYFMAHIGDENLRDYNDEAKAAVVGRLRPLSHRDGVLAVMQFEAEFCAKWRAIRADAMLEARKS